MAHHQPMATSTTASTSIITPNIQRKGMTKNPVIRAMISNNRMSNCHDVSRMLQECQASKSNDRVCQVAMEYMDMCK